MTDPGRQQAQRAPEATPVDYHTVIEAANAGHHDDCDCDHGRPCTCAVHVAEAACRLLGAREVDGYWEVPRPPSLRTSEALPYMHPNRPALVIPVPREHVGWRCSRALCTWNDPQATGLTRSGPCPECGATEICRLEQRTEPPVVPPHPDGAGLAAQIMSRPEDGRSHLWQEQRGESPRQEDAGPSADYRAGWDDAIEAVHKVLGERFTRRAPLSESTAKERA